jgi:glutaredoxin
LDAQVLGISVDHVPCLKAWAESLGGINYPLLSDFWPHGEVAQKYAAFIEEEGKSERAIFVIDKLGVVRYIDIHDIDEQPSNDEVRQILREVDPDAAKREAEREQPEFEVPELPRGGIVMYCTPWCPACRRAQRFFRENGLEITEVDITKTLGAAEQVMKWADGYRTTPTFDIDGTIIVDWDVRELTRVLKEKGYLEIK